MLYQQTAAHDQMLLGEWRALGASTESDRAARQEMSDDISITWQTAAGVVGLAFSPDLSITLKKALFIYCIKLLLIFRYIILFLWEGVM